MSQVIYLDHAATTPLDPRVFEAMEPYLREQFYNPSATYLAARAIKKDIESARTRVAHWLGSRPSEVIFTAGGTEANNLAIHGIMQQYPGSNIVVSAIEHDSILHPADQYDVRVAPVRPDGIVDIAALSALIDEHTVLVSIMYANNELGTVQPIRDIAKVVEKQRAERPVSADKPLPLYFHTDACQASLYLDLHTARLGVDLLTINASKMYGPKQIGALYVRAGVVLKPQAQGGGQERSLRSGTENVAGIMGLAMALDLAQADRHHEVARLRKLQQYTHQLIAEQLPSAVVNGSYKLRTPNNIHLTLPGSDNERLMMQLDEQAIQVAVGSACSASSEEPSHVLRAIGMSDADARASLRLTMGHATDEASMKTVIQALSQLV